MSNFRTSMCWSVRAFILERDPRWVIVGKFAYQDDAETFLKAISGAESDLFGLFFRNRLQYKMQKGRVLRPDEGWPRKAGEIHNLGPVAVPGPVTTEALHVTEGGEGRTEVNPGN